MASAVASNLPAAAPAAVPVPYGWLSPRVSLSRDASADLVDPVAMATPEPAISKDFIDFEFSLGGSATMLPADELFADGKLLPLRKPAPFPDPEAAAPAPERAQPEEAMAMPAQPSTEPIIKPLRAEPERHYGLAVARGSQEPRGEGDELCGGEVAEAAPPAEHRRARVVGCRGGVGPRVGAAAPPRQLRLGGVAVAGVLPLLALVFVVLLRARARRRAPPLARLRRRRPQPAPHPPGPLPPPPLHLLVLLQDLHPRGAQPGPAPSVAAAVPVRGLPAHELVGQDRVPGAGTQLQLPLQLPRGVQVAVPRGGGPVLLVRRPRRARRAQRARVLAPRLRLLQGQEGHRGCQGRRRLGRRGGREVQVVAGAEGARVERRAAGEILRLI